MDRELTNTEKLITETFVAHEHLAPDGDGVLAAARERVERRRAVLTRPLAVAAGVVVLTLAAVTIVVLNRSGSSPTDGVAGPADQVEVSGPASKAQAGPAVADLTMPFDLGWLPPGKVDYLAQRINIGGADDDPDTPLYGGEYMLTVTAGDQVLLVDVQQFRMVDVDEAAFKSGPGNPVTIDGRRAVESSRSGGPGGYELYVAHPDGGSMYVNVAADHGSTAPAQQLVDAGRRIARNISFPGTTTVTPGFGLRDLPGGLRICAFDVEGLSLLNRELSTLYSLGTCDSMPPIHVNTAVMEEPDGTTTPGRPVQGHATRHVNEDGYHRLWVLDAVDGTPVHLAGKVPLTELYDVADRLVLPG